MRGCGRGRRVGLWRWRMWWGERDHECTLRPLFKWNGYVWVELGKVLRRITDGLRSMLLAELRHKGKVAR
jgi:hypothetical protein